MIMRLCTQKAYSTNAATVFLTGGIYLNLSPKPWTQGQGTSVATKTVVGSVKSRQSGLMQQQTAGLFLVSMYFKNVPQEVNEMSTGGTSHFEVAFPTDMSTCARPRSTEEHILASWSSRCHGPLA